MGAWNVISLIEDDHLSLLSSELKHLNIGIAALSDVRRPDSGEIMVGGYTYYWSGHSDSYHAQGVAVAVSNKLTPMINEVTPGNKRITRLRIRHSFGVISLVSVSALTEASDLTLKDTFYATLESVVVSAPDEIHFSSWGISMHRLELIGMVIMLRIWKPCVHRQPESP